MQAAINAAAKGKVNEAHIPTPETILSSLRYDELYPPIFSQPATYIRFSSTVEDCSGSPYNMVDEDDVFLKIMNQRRGVHNQCTEDQFEEVMSFFEETAQLKQPYAAVDNPPVLAFSDMEDCMHNDAVEDSVKRFAKDVYEHWKVRRISTGNRSLLPSLKVSGFFSFPISLVPMRVLTLSSSKQVKTQTTPIRMFASVGVRSARFVRLAAEMPRAPRN